MSPLGILSFFLYAVSFLFSSFSPPSHKEICLVYYCDLDAILHSLCPSLPVSLYLTLPNHWFKGSWVGLPTVIFSSISSPNSCLSFILLTYLSKQHPPFFFHTNTVFCSFCIINLTLSVIDFFFYSFIIFTE